MKKTFLSTATFALFLLGLVALQSCSITQAIRLKDCEYTYSHISDVTFMDMTSQDRKSIAGVTMMTRALLGKADKITLGCTIHIRVHNPNKQTASIDKLFYTVALDSIPLAEGSNVDAFIVAGQSTADMPIRISVDVKELLKKHSQSTMINTVKNFLNMSDTPTHVTVMLKPLINMAGIPVALPKPIPLSFEYGGKKKN
ncbi:MAG: LEA type 2 family protein [Paludibacteraceae bacterium]|nr:LEA type 2 family protein [Paludibacteraceae bacterium]